MAQVTRRVMVARYRLARLELKMSQERHESDRKKLMALLEQQDEVIKLLRTQLAIRDLEMSKLAKQMVRVAENLGMDVPDLPIINVQ